MSASLHRSRAELVDGEWSVSIDPGRAGWSYSGLRVVELAPGGSVVFDTGADEVLVLPLAGSAVVGCDGETAELTGRTSVFDGVTDFAYAPRDAHVSVTSRGGGRFAVPGARARRRLAFRHVPASATPVELRGAGHCSRQVNNIATPDVLEADRLIVCEVLTPAGNWSSYPPHKHDEDRHDEDRGAVETALEEIYYFEVADGPDGPGLAYQRVYGTADRPVDVLAEVRSGEVVLVPHGWHGPSMAVPGYDLYYLNVMAGPGEERAWLICDDPAHAWVRSTWESQPVDSRLPFYESAGRMP
jgi:5-deoxy-glucuronate isomerase